MRVVGYTRVSSVEQAENTNALEQHCERLKAAGAEEVFVDVESGWKAKKTRPQLEQLMEMVRSRQVDMVLVTRLDRLSRKGLVSFQIFEDFLNAGVILKALDEPFDLTTAAGRAMAGQLVVFAQLHSDQKSESVRHGWKHLRDRKVAMNPPFGYRKIDNQFRLDDEEGFLCLLDDKQEKTKAVLAREIVDIFLEKRSLRLCLQVINKRYGIQITAHNNETGSEAKGGRVAQKMFRFSPGGLSSWLRNPVLQGHLAYLQRDKKRSQITYNTHSDQRLISEEEAREIEAILEHNRRVRGWGTPELKYPLSGLVFCGGCRSACYSCSGTRGKTPGRNHYFQCKNWRIHGCGQKKMTRMERVEEAVVAALVMRSRELAEAAAVPDEVEEPLEIKQLRNQIEYFLNAPGDKSLVEPLINQMRSEIARLQVQGQQQAKGNEELKSQLQASMSEPEYWLGASDEEKKLLYHALVERVVVRDSEVVE